MDRQAAYHQRALDYFRKNGASASFRQIGREFQLVLDQPWLRFSWRIPGATNRKEIRVTGLRRSGQHAIIRWIMFQVHGRSCFLNDCTPGLNPFSTCETRDSIVSTWFGEHNRLRWKAEQAGRLSRKGVLIYNYEDSRIAEAAGRSFEESRVEWVGSSRERFDLLILRDPYNMLASRLRWIRGEGRPEDHGDFQHLILMWKEHARVFLGGDPALSERTGVFVPVSYNKWFTSSDYRRDLAKKLGLSFDDKGIDRVAKWGPTIGGASFDGLDFDGRAREMKVLERWKAYRDDPFFRDILRDDELRRLSASIFPEFIGIPDGPSRHPD